MVPAYYEKIYRRVYTQRLDPTAPGGGITVANYPANGNSDTRYREVFPSQKSATLSAQPSKATSTVSSTPSLPTKSLLRKSPS